MVTWRTTFHGALMAREDVVWEKPNNRVPMRSAADRSASVVVCAYSSSTSLGVACPSRRWECEGPLQRPPVRYRRQPSSDSRTSPTPIRATRFVVKPLPLCARSDLTLQTETRSAVMAPPKVARLKDSDRRLFDGECFRARIERIGTGLAEQLTVYWREAVTQSRSENLHLSREAIHRKVYAKHSAFRTCVRVLSRR